MDELHVFGRNGPFASTPDPIKLYIFSAPLPAVSDNEKNAVAADPCRTFSHRMQAQTPIKTKPHRHHGQQNICGFEDGYVPLIAE